MGHTVGVPEPRSKNLRRLTTPRAAALAGVLFAVLFAAVIYLIRSSLPEGAQPGSQWLATGNDKIGLASELMPFAGICFLWFIGVVRANLGRYEDRFFATVLIVVSSSSTSEIRSSEASASCKLDHNAASWRSGV